MVLSIQFVKIILHTFIQLKKRRLPLKFVRTYSDEICDVAQLTVSDGRVWKVKVVREGQHIWFENGFDEFVKHYSIRHGYLLVFKFKGMSNFSVHIIDKSCCEIQYPPHRPAMHSEAFKCNHQINGRMEKNDPFDFFASPPSLQSTVKSSCKRKFDSQLRNPMINSFSKERDFECEREAKRCKTQEVGVDIIKSAAISGDDNENDNSDAEKESQVFVAAKFKEIVSKLSCDSKMALNEARMYKPKSDAFMVVIQTDNSRDLRKMDVPVAFAKKYKHKITTEMIRVHISDEEHWLIEFGISPKWRTSACLLLTEGWSDFVFCNNLEIGGVCIFELMNSEKTFMLKAIPFRGDLE